MNKKRIMNRGHQKPRYKASAACPMGLEIVSYAERKGTSESESDTYGPWDSSSYCHVTATTSFILEEQGRSCWVNLTQKKEKKVLFEPSWVWPQNIIVYKASVKLPNPLTWKVVCTSQKIYHTIATTLPATEFTFTYRHISPFRSNLRSEYLIEKECLRLCLKSY